MDAVYLDHAATTPLRDEVAAAMRPYGSEIFGNPSSLHVHGREAHAALEGAREDVAGALGVRRSEIRFVRGGTESDNIAVIGSCRARRVAEGRPGLVVSAIEHSAVLEAARHVEAWGDADVTEMAVSSGGELDLDALTRATARGPATVSVMRVNNETGLVLPVDQVVAAVQGSDVTVHTDASQALGKVPVSIPEMGVDLLTATGHKLGGPRGTGILFVREGTELAPLLFGGGQERGLRPGTEDVAGAVGLATAIRLAVDELDDVGPRLEALRSRLESRLAGTIDGLRVNCAEGPRAPHVSSVGIPGLSDGEALLMGLDLEGVAVSGGSACHSGAAKGSHVLAALYGDEDPMTTVRFSFGHETTDDDVDRAVAATLKVVERLHAGSPGVA